MPTVDVAEASRGGGAYDHFGDALLSPCSELVAGSGLGAERDERGVGYGRGRERSVREQERGEGGCQAGAREWDYGGGNYARQAPSARQQAANGAQGKPHTATAPASAPRNPYLQSAAMLKGKASRPRP